MTKVIEPYKRHRTAKMSYTHANIIPTITRYLYRLRFRRCRYCGAPSLQKVLDGLSDSTRKEFHQRGI
ncbi:hypothetical protein Agabi119p4_4987 [Agaricus bisporus var. burnettii]|uniref:Uncharacterized protein n=1 Tax=Agaricus bisporus var. burnettii TaxID=192524 RepID=A0A8H7KHG7_AGABI|nr:hypothetical protein Agabi119p4_4987 [Agaricus bisporus var. burnettii]